MREKMKIQSRAAFAEAFFLLFVLLKQFYIFPSGGVGIADACLFVSFFLLLWDCLKEKKNSFRFQEDRLLYVFLFFVIAINICYGILLKKTEFFRYSVFWIYNVGVIWVFRKLACWNGQRFLVELNWIAKGNILLQLLIYVSGHGRIFYEYWGAIRYQGTFNDPNQLAVFLFLMILLQYLYSCQYRDRSFLLFYILAIPVIMASKSTGVLLGIFVFTILAVVYFSYRVASRHHSARKIWLLGVLGGFLLIALFLWWIWPSAEFDVKAMDYNVLTRIQEKLWKIAHGGLGGLFLDRGMDKLLIYPQYLLYGAGEGGFERFTLAGQSNEIHCCLFSILFCYGIIPTMILLVWLVQNLRYATASMKCAVAALLVESFFLINYRQPLFWMILLYGSVIKKNQTLDECKEEGSK